MQQEQNGSICVASRSIENPDAIRLHSVDRCHRHSGLSYCLTCWGFRLLRSNLCIQCLF